MKTALICIAKDEDHYIDEWIQYHTKLGFSDIFVYQNNWRYSGDKLVYKNVQWIEFDGEAKQLPAYNDFISKNWYKYDFAAFWDVDEFLCLKNTQNLNLFLESYRDFFAIGVNWRCFGDNGMQGVINQNYSLVKRFTMCEKTLNKHIKTILNFRRCADLPQFINPHFVNIAYSNNFTVDVGMKTYIHGPFNEIFTENIAQLNHYNCKTWEEFQQKFTRGKADTPVNHPAYNYTVENFHRHNHNDIEDLTAKNFLTDKD